VELYKLEKRIDQLYNNNIITAKELGILDVKIMERIAEIESGVKL